MGWIGSLATLPAALVIVAAASATDLPFSVAGDRSATIVWGQRFGSSNDDWINDMVSLRGGDVLAVGFLNRRDGSPPSDWSALAAQLTADGRLARQRTYGDGGGMDAFWSVAEAGDGRRMFAGFTTRMGGGGIDGFSLLSAEDGRLLKENAFGGGGYDRFTDVAAIRDGGRPGGALPAAAAPWLSINESHAAGGPLVDMAR